MRADAESLRQKLETATFTANTNSKHLVERAALIPAQTDSETPTRKELGKLFNVSQEAIRIWEENGKLKELGWERIPHKQNPVHTGANQLKTGIVVGTTQPIAPTSKHFRC